MPCMALGAGLSNTLGNEQLQVQLSTQSFPSGLRQPIQSSPMVAQEGEPTLHTPSITGKCQLSGERILSFICQFNLLVWLLR